MHLAFKPYHAKGLRDVKIWQYIVPCSQMRFEVPML